MAVRRQLAVVAASLAFGLVALAGCQDEEPQPRLPEETTSSPSPSPTEAESTEAAQETPEEFARRWQAAKDELQATGDGDAYRSLIDRCGPCSEFIDQVEQIYADGGRIEAGQTKVLSVESAGATAGLESFDVALRDSPSIVLDADDAVVQEFSGGRSTLRIDLEKIGSGFVIRRVTRVAG